MISLFHCFSLESAWSAITDYYYVLVDWVNPARSAILNKIELGLVIARIMFWCNTQRTDTDNFGTLFSI